jgi:hypothetical protein
MLGRSLVPNLGNFGENIKKGMDSFYVCEIMAIPKETRASYDNVSVIKSYGFP